MKKNAKVRGATPEKPALPCRRGLAHAEANAVLPETTKRHKRQKGTNDRHLCLYLRLTTETLAYAYFIILYKICQWK
jgi:hypothetical protein